MRLLSICILASFAVLFAGGSRAASLIKDGGFETPAPPAGSYTDYNPGQKIGA